jgi:hypothetical protein
MALRFLTCIPDKDEVEANALFANMRALHMRLPSSMTATHKGPLTRSTNRTAAKPSTC